MMAVESVVGEKTVSVRLSPATYAWLDKLAKSQKRSMGAQVAFLLEETRAKLERREQRQDVLRSVLADDAEREAESDGK